MGGDEINATNSDRTEVQIAGALDQVTLSRSLFAWHTLFGHRA